MYMIETSFNLWQLIRNWVRSAVLPAPMTMEPAPPDRAELFEQLRALRSKRAVEAAQCLTDVDALTGQWKVVQGQADVLHHQINRLQHEAFCSSLDHTAAEDRLLAQITEKSSTSLALFLEELTGELDVLNKTEALVLPSAFRNYAIGKKVMGLETDDPSRKRRATALHAARERARQMQLEELSVEQMNAELIRLRRTIPVIEHEVLHNERASIVAYN